DSAPPPAHRGGNVKSRTLTCITAVMLFAALASPFPLDGQNSPDHSHKHHHYKLIDVGTFGGPAGGLFDSQKQLTSNGTLVGWADTAVPDPYAPNCFNPDCVIQHGFQ